MEVEKIVAYRELTENDVIQSGDQWYKEEIDNWFTVDVGSYIIGMEYVSWKPMRRPIE